MLLFDANISFRIIKKITSVFPESIHVSSLGLQNSSDIEIWKKAKDLQLCIVTYDFDFINLAVLYGSPPKIIRIKSRNLSNNELSIFLIHSKDLIREFLFNESYASIHFLELT